MLTVYIVKKEEEDALTSPLSNRVLRVVSNNNYIQCLYCAMRLFVLYIMNNHSSLGIRIKFVITALSCLDEENRSLYYYYVFCFVRKEMVDCFIL